VVTKFSEEVIASIFPEYGRKKQKIEDITSFRIVANVSGIHTTVLHWNKEDSENHIYGIKDLKFQILFLDRNSALRNHSLHLSTNKIICFNKTCIFYNAARLSVITLYFIMWHHSHFHLRSLQNATLI
jgi:hypothetical protein